MGVIGIGISVSYRVLKGNYLVSVSYRYIGIIPIYRYRYDQSPRICIGLNSLLTDTDRLISVSVYRYQSNSNAYEILHSD